MKESSRKRLRALPLARSSPSSPERCCASTTSPSPSSSPIVYMSTAAARDPTVAAMAVLMAKALTWARERERVSRSLDRQSLRSQSSSSSFPSLRVALGLTAVGTALLRSAGSMGNASLPCALVDTPRQLSAKETFVANGRGDWLTSALRSLSSPPREVPQHPEGHPFPSPC